MYYIDCDEKLIVSKDSLEIYYNFYGRWLLINNKEIATQICEECKARYMDDYEISLKLENKDINYLLFDKKESYSENLLELDDEWEYLLNLDDNEIITKEEFKSNHSVITINGYAISESEEGIYDSVDGFLKERGILVNQVSTNQYTDNEYTYVTEFKDVCIDCACSDTEVELEVVIASGKKEKLSNKIVLIDYREDTRYCVLDKSEVQILYCPGCGYYFEDETGELTECNEEVFTEDEIIEGAIMDEDGEIMSLDDMDLSPEYKALDQFFVDIEEKAFYKIENDIWIDEDGEIYVNKASKYSLCEAELVKIH